MVLDLCAVCLLHLLLSAQCSVFAGNPNFTSVDAPLFAGSAVVNFSSLWPVVTIGSGATLQIDNLQLYGIKSIYGPDITQRHGLLRVRGSATWPTVDAQPGAEVS